MLFMGAGWFSQKYGIFDVSPTSTAGTAIITVTSHPVLPPTSLSTEVISTEIAADNDGGMAYIPAGEFTMGDDFYNADEKPAHEIHLDAFFIDKYEVTNALYKTCVDADVCPLAAEYKIHDAFELLRQFRVRSYPVIYITWNMANTYCDWRGAQLPTEAQWEKAARGTDGRTYPWGEDIA